MLLYLTTPEEDYLQDQLLYGFRQLFGNHCVDYPKKDKMYVTCEVPKDKLYGKGFTIWKSLPDIDIDRENILDKVSKGFFDYIVFGSAKRQGARFKEICATIRDIAVSAKLIFIDGEDIPQACKAALDYGTYFKREQSTTAHASWPSWFTPHADWSNVEWVPPESLHPISFCIPAVKIRDTALAKAKMFATHVQCAEAYNLEEVKNNCQKSYAFDQEADYYKDIAISYFAITEQKAGWDCMRHYEIAANLTVPCFYKFDDKEDCCAPHGLVDMVNCISFETAEELEEKTKEALEIYPEMLANVKQWIYSKTCSKIASYVLGTDVG